VNVFFAKHSLDSISLEIVNRHALSYVQVTANAPLVQMQTRVSWNAYILRLALVSMC